jgi:hypothetical protein
LAEWAEDSNRFPRSLGEFLFIASDAMPRYRARLLTKRFPNARQKVLLHNAMKCIRNDTESDCDRPIRSLPIWTKVNQQKRVEFRSLFVVKFPFLLHHVR